MRKLTIKRRKSIVACAVKDLVYIEDYQSSDITIQGVPCRKIGEIKNGEEKTFEISEEKQKIFIVFELLLKDTFHTSIAIEAGQENVSLSGKHYYNVSGNPFRFDGVQLTEEEKANQKKRNRKGAIITIAAVVIGVIIGLFSSGMFNFDTISEKTFTKDGFEITLTDQFKESALEGFFACYESKTAFAFVVREEKDILGDITLDEYADIVLEVNGRTELKKNVNGDFIWFSYTDTPDTQELYYLSVCIQGEDNFWIITFSTSAVNQEDFHPKFIQWAESCKVN